MGELHPGNREVPRVFLELSAHGSPSGVPYVEQQTAVTFGGVVFICLLCAIRLYWMWRKGWDYEQMKGHRDLCNLPSSPHRQVKVLAAPFLVAAYRHLRRFHQQET